MAINDLEQAAMTAASTGVKPPNYRDRASLDWMSYVPESYSELPAAVKTQREREVKQLESGIPEAIRQAAQPMARRGLYGSGLQLEDIGQASLDRQIAIDKAKTLAEIDPIKARMALGDVARQRAVQRGTEERRRFEQQEAYSEQQKARDQLMEQQTGKAITDMLTGTGGVSDFLFGQKASPAVQALIASETDPAKRAALAKALGPQSSGALSSIFGQSTASNIATGGVLGAVGSALFGNKGLLGGKIQEAGSSIRKALTGGGEGVGANIIADDATDLGFDSGKEIGNIYNPDQVESEAFKRAGPQVGGAGMLHYDSEGNRVDATGKRIDASSNLENQARMRNLSYQEIDGVPRTFSDDPRITYEGTNIVDPEKQRAFLQAQTGQLGEMSLEQEAAIRNMSESGPMQRDGDFVDFEESGLLGGSYIADEGLGAAMDADYFQDGLNTTFEEFADEYSPSLGSLGSSLGSLGSGIQDALQGISDVVPGNILDTGLSLAISSALNPEGIKGVAKNPFSFIGPQIMAQSGVGPLSIAKMLATQTAPTGAALGSALAGSVIGLPMALMGMGAAKGKKDRARDEAEEIRNRTGSARYNFVPGELAMVGNARRSPVLDEANVNFRFTDELTGMNLIYEQDPRRSVMGGDSLSKRGQDFAREAGIDYTNPDPDVQNTSQKWLGKQQFYSELIPDLKPIFMAGLKGEMSREQTEDAVSKYANKFFEENPAIRQIHTINKRIKDIEHQEADEIDTVQDQIMALKEQANVLYEQVPLAWKKATGLTTQVISLEEILEKSEKDRIRALYESED